MASSVKISEIPQISQKIKTKLRRPPEHHKISHQQFLTKLKPLDKKSINNLTKFEFRPRILKKFDETNHFVNAFLSNS